MTSYTIVMQPPMLPAGEYTYKCVGEEHLRRVYSALKTLNVEVIDVTRSGESMTQQELEELLGE